MDVRIIIHNLQNPNADFLCIALESAFVSTEDTQLNFFPLYKIQKYLQLQTYTTVHNFQTLIFSV